MIRAPSYKGRTVLVTGASSGIGRATALAFAKAGANLVLVARRKRELAAVAAAARKEGVAALVVVADVTDQSAVAACFRRARQRFGSIDVVVNNAGILLPARIEDTSRELLQRMLDVNLFGALWVMQEAVKAMRAQGRGHIVNVASLAGRRGFSPLGAYCATKFALVGLTEALRVELVGTKVHVSLVMPSAVDTPMVVALKDDAATAGLWPDALSVPPSWVVQSIFLALRFKLAEIAVPPGGALLEKLAALAPGTTDNVLHGASSLLERRARKKS